VVDSKDAHVDQEIRIGDGSEISHQNNNSTWTTWLPPTSLEAAKSFLYKVGEEMVNNVNSNINEPDIDNILGNNGGKGGGGIIGSSSAWDEEEAMVERWKETMGVLTDDEDDGDDDDGKSDRSGEEEEMRDRGKRDESTMKFRMEEVVRIPRRR